MTVQEERDLEAVRATLLRAIELNKITLGYLAGQGEPGVTAEAPAMGIVSALKELATKLDVQAENLSRAV